MVIWYDPYTSMVMTKYYILTPTECDIYFGTNTAQNGIL